MKLKTFSLMIDEDGSLDDREMQAELEGCEVLKVWEQFLEVERVWLIMVGYRVSASRKERRRGEKVNAGRRARQRLVEGLDPLEARVFEALRAWRAALATAKQTGPHFIFTNAQLVEVVKRNPQNLTEQRIIGTSPPSAEVEWRR